jgi:hypothetical protein
MEWIMMTLAGKRSVSEYVKAIPWLKLSIDYEGDSLNNFYRMMAMAQDDAVFLQDDIILCKDFIKKVVEAVKKYPKDVIQFFTMRRKPYEVGEPYYENGSKWLMNQCFYLPKEISRELAEYKTEDEEILKRGSQDMLMKAYFKEKKMKYVQWNKSLVQHKIGKSVMYPKSSRRIDERFKME